MERYDVCVIGGGPSGYAAAMRAIDFKQKVLLIEKSKIGGAGLYNGALSSKTFWEISRGVMEANLRLNKYTDKDLTIDYREVLKDVNDTILLRKIQLETHLLLLLRKHADCISYIKGSAELLSKNEIKIQTGEGAEKVVYAENIILATGTRPRKLPNIPIDEQSIVTSDGIEHFQEFPKSMVILGAGVIGCEWATIFANFGTTKVNIIDKADRILPFEDEDISYTIQTQLEEKGVTIHKNSRLIRMNKVNDMVEYELEYKDGHTEVFTVEKALVAVGRVTNVEGLGLENAGIKLTARNHVEDIDTQTNVPNIYAVGDLTSEYALVNVGELEGRHAIEKIAGVNPPPLSYKNISTIMFLDPETAGVGINEQEAQQRNISYRMVSIDYSLIPRAIAMRRTKGFFKILVTDDDHMRVLGMRAVGEHASSAIQAVALLIAMDKSIEEISELIHPHPSIIEGIQECVRVLKGKSILKPEVFKDTLRIRCWKDGSYYNSCQYY
ncbi:NAD(P)/FAD-dependent oxidoreductase [Cytophagaceae bacterium ABcell3]|nr:NAD(P)/FAD-dependent oxidoreductase [Cytophagaceae bacterium ABcell3]